MTDAACASCLEKQHQIKAFFSNCLSEEAKYEKLIELGRQQAPLAPLYQTPENLVSGCQSQTYLRAYFSGAHIIFETSSDALISAGLGVLLTKVYSQESPETVLKCPPYYLDELGIAASLTPNRASGLYSLHTRMKQEALKLLMQRDRT